jgi:hypothetical protein
MTSKMAISPQPHAKANKLSNTTSLLHPFIVVSQQQIPTCIHHYNVRRKISVAEAYGK